LGCGIIVGRRSSSEVEVDVDDEVVESSELSWGLGWGGVGNGSSEEVDVDDWVDVDDEVVESSELSWGLGWGGVGNGSCEEVDVDDWVDDSSDVDSGSPVPKIVKKLSSELDDDSAVSGVGPMAGTKLVGSAGGSEEVVPVPVPIPVTLENEMPSGDVGVVEVLDVSESDGSVVDERTLETPTVIPDVSLEGSDEVVVGTIAEEFVEGGPSVTFEPLSSNMTVTGTMTTVVNRVLGSSRFRRGASLLNSRLTNRGK
jgi:hypothetical protein